MYYQSPVGLLKLIIHEGFINEIIFLDNDDDINGNGLEENISTKNKAVSKKCKKQFDEYFSGKRKIFDLPIKQSGTPFQENVWNELIKILSGKR